MVSKKMIQKSSNQPKLTHRDVKELGGKLQRVLDFGYDSKWQMMYFSFLKGLATGFGVFLGGTVLIVLLLWVLSFFDNIPILEQVYNTLNNSYN